MGLELVDGVGLAGGRTSELVDGVGVGTGLGGGGTPVPMGFLVVFLLLFRRSVLGETSAVRLAIFRFLTHEDFHKSKHLSRKMFKLLRIRNSRTRSNFSHKPLVSKVCPADLKKGQGYGKLVSEDLRRSFRAL